MAAITYQGESLIARKQADGQVLTIDRIVLANIPDLDPAKPVDRNEQLPAAGQIVLNEQVSQHGHINPNLVVYSLMLGTGGASFEFNWLGLYSSADDVVVAITYLPVQRKSSSVAMTRNFMLEFSGAAETTDIHIDAESWQVDFSARLNGTDNRARQMTEDVFGRQLFYGDGCKVVHTSGDMYEVLPGTGYVGGIRFDYQGMKIRIAEQPAFVYLDVSQVGDALSDLRPVVEVVVSGDVLTDYQDDHGAVHFVEKVASCDIEWNVTDCRNNANRNKVFNRQVVHFKRGAVFGHYVEDGRRLLPRLRIGSVEYVAVSDVADNFTFTSIAVDDRLDGTVSVQTSAGKRIFSRVLAEAVIRKDIVRPGVYNASLLGFLASEPGQAEFDNKPVLDKLIANGFDGVIHFGTGVFKWGSVVIPSTRKISFIGVSQQPTWNTDVVKCKNTTTVFTPTKDNFDHIIKYGDDSGEVRGVEISNIYFNQNHTDENFALTGTGSSVGLDLLVFCFSKVKNLIFTGYHSGYDASLRWNGFECYFDEIMFRAAGWVDGLTSKRSIFDLWGKASGVYSFPSGGSISNISFEGFVGTGISIDGAVDLIIENINFEVGFHRDILAENVEVVHGVDSNMHPATKGFIEYKNVYGGLVVNNVTGQGLGAVINHDEKLAWAMTDLFKCTEEYGYSSRILICNVGLQDLKSNVKLLNLWGVDNQYPSGNITNSGEVTINNVSITSTLGYIADFKLKSGVKLNTNFKPYDGLSVNKKYSKCTLVPFIGDVVLSGKDNLYPHRISFDNDVQMHYSTRARKPGAEDSWVVSPENYFEVLSNSYFRYETELLINVLYSNNSGKDGATDCVVLLSDNEEIQQNRCVGLLADGTEIKHSDYLRNTNGSIAAYQFRLNIPADSTVVKLFLRNTNESFGIRIYEVSVKPNMPGFRHNIGKAYSLRAGEGVYTHIQTVDLDEYLQPVSNKNALSPLIIRNDSSNYPDTISHTTGFSISSGNTYNGDSGHGLQMLMDDNGRLFVRHKSGATWKEVNFK